MTRDLMAYGITTQVYTPGASTFVYLGADPYVVNRFIYGGQTLGYYAGVPSPSITAATLAAFLLRVPLVGLYTYGPAPVALLGSNPIYVTTYLSQGYNVTLGY